MLQQNLPPAIEPVLFSAVVEHTTDEVFILEVDTDNIFQMLFVNEAFRKKFRLSDRDVIGKEIGEFIPEEMLSSVRQKLKHCVNTGEILLFNETLILQNNQKSESSNQLIPIKGSNNIVEFIVGVFRDITELKTSRDELLKSNILLDTIFSTISTGIIIQDEKGKMIDANAAAEKILGFNKEDYFKGISKNGTVMLRPDNSTMPENEFTCIKTLVDRLPRENELMGAFNENRPISWINVSAAPVNLNGYGVVVTYQDVSAIIRKEREAEETRNMLYNILNSSTNLIAFFDKNAKLEFFNKASERHMKRLYSNLTLKKGDNAFDYIPPTSADLFSSHVEQVKQGKIIEHEHELEYPDGDRIWLLRRYFPSYNLDNEFVGFVISSANITQLKENEMRIKKQNEQLREIAKMQSHQLRKPVANILGLTELINENQGNPKVLAEMIQMLKASAAGLDEIIHSIVIKSQAS